MGFFFSKECQAIDADYYVIDFREKLEMVTEAAENDPGAIANGAIECTAKAIAANIVDLMICRAQLGITRLETCWHTSQQPKKGIVHRKNRQLYFKNFDFDYFTPCDARKAMLRTKQIFDNDPRFCVDKEPIKHANDLRLECVALPPPDYGP